MSEFEFKVGDKVKCTFYGDRIFTLYESEDDRYLVITCEGDSFLKNGTQHGYHTHPVLTLVERPKTKVKVTRWASIYPNDCMTYVHNDEQSARKHSDKDAIACVELTGEYEI